MMGALVDGYILNATYNNDEVVQAALTSGLPVITTDIKLQNFTCVSIDDGAAMQAICHHLLATGHKKFGIVSFPVKRLPGELTSLAEFSTDYDNGVAFGRISACITALSDAGIDLHTSYVAEQPHSETGGRKKRPKRCWQRNRVFRLLFVYLTVLHSAFINFVKTTIFPCQAKLPLPGLTILIFRIRRLV